MGQLTEQQLQTKLNELWTTHYTDDELTNEDRVRLVDYFTRNYLDGSTGDIYAAKYYHPMTRIKRRYNEPKRSALDILADFILRAGTVAERGAEYPVKNAAQAVTNYDSRQKNEIGLFTDEIDEGAGDRVPYGYMSESDIVEQLAHTPKKPVSVAEFRAELIEVKENAEYHAARLSKKYGYDEADTLKRIEALKVERVRECRICTGAFYPRNIRRQVCDQQHGVNSEKIRSKESACELKESRSYHVYYYKNVKMSLKNRIYK